MVFLCETVSSQNGGTDILLFSRNEKKEKITTRITNFRPYFYVDDAAVVPDDNRIISIEKGYKEILGGFVKKIVVRSAGDVIELRKMFDVTYEADIQFSNRYLIDIIGERSFYDLRTFYFDIETNDEQGFPDDKNPVNEVISISFLDSFSGDKRKMLFKHPKCVVTEFDDITDVFEDEESLISSFLKYIIKYDPDIISGWHVDSFDLTYMIARMTKLGINYSNISPLNSVKIDPKYGEVTIKGRVVLDMLKAYEHFRKISNQGRAESYSLEFTSQQELGEGKISHKETFNDLWINNPRKLLDYNLRDVELVYRINEKCKIIDFFNSIVCKSCSQLRNIFHTSVLVDGFLLNTVHNKCVFPSKKKNESIDFAGAFCFEPIPGLYDFVFGLDVKGMYPNIIKTFNVGYETFNPNGNIKINEKIGFDSGIGIISGVIRNLEKERNKYKKLMKEAQKNGNEQERQLNNYRQYAVKVLTNSVYGFLGFSGSRLYKPEIAESVTIMGQNLIKWTAAKLKEKDYVVIYGDTDSCYVKAKQTNTFALIKEGKELTSLINNSYKEFAKQYGSDDCSLEIEFEKIFKKILFVGKKGDKDGVGAKKKYAYIPLWIDGKSVCDKIECTGFSSRRSDSPRIARKVQRNVLEKILTGSSKEEILTYCKDIELKIRKKEILDDEIGFPKGISEDLKSYGGVKIKDDGSSYRVGTPPVISGAIYSNKYLGTHFGKGSKPKWIYVKTVPKNYPSTHVITFEESIPEGFIPDWDKMYNHLFNEQLNAIFVAVGWNNFPSMNHEVKTLDNWFKKGE